jgi:hypothetical protein
MDGSDDCKDTNNRVVVMSEYMLDHSIAFAKPTKPCGLTIPHTHIHTHTHTHTHCVSSSNWNVWLTSHMIMISY